MRFNDDGRGLFEDETALIYCARAAVGWSARENRGSSGASGLGRELMRAAAFLGRVRLGTGRAPPTLFEAVTLFSRPIAEWLPGFPSEPLLEDGEPTALCIDLADEGGTNPGAELQQQVIRRVKGELSGRDEGPARYTAFRRALVEKPLVEDRVARSIALDVGIPVAELYERPTERFVLRIPEGEVVFPCPRCRWPMSVSQTRVECLSEVCRAEGARYVFRERALVPLGRFSASTPVSRDGHVQLKFGIWRYTTLPGLEELRLADDLVALSGTEVTLWPNLDEYDLDVRRGGTRWRVDLKDHASAIRLGERLASIALSESTWIVVPDRRRDQLAILQRICREHAAYQFATASGFLRIVESARTQT